MPDQTPAISRLVNVLTACRGSNDRVTVLLDLVDEIAALGATADLHRALRLWERFAP